MGAFNDAVRDCLEAELRCPKCQAMNKPHAKPTLEKEQSGDRFCNNCSTRFTPKKED